MLYIFIGFILGTLIPYTARRFAKIMLQTPTFAYALYYLCIIKKRVSKQKRLSNHKYITLRNHYFMRSLGYGIITSALTFLISSVFSPSESPWFVFFVIILLNLMEIDKRIQYLPDILTSPLLIMGFTYAVFAGNLLGENTIEATENSALGAVFGYFIPVIASLLLIKKYPNNFGGGDIKILAAIGAWLGLTSIPYVILLACAIFAVSCFINKKRAGAFGPAIVLASLLMLFYLRY